MECLCQMVRRRCHGEGESEFFLGDKGIYFIGEDRYVSQISLGGGRCAYVLQLLR